ncbi:hypothetical protein, conserved [Eimeria praecox]|uniref:Uncharacterized protein n=1 Tax=Eimeria praecox TaxID=51316 RepID=U6G3T6_9EIME|nr:hypothetical protein, conserved [Eimeria praecox]
MLGIKEILKKNLLNSYDLELLMENLEMLVNHALHRKKESIDTMRPKYIVEKLGFALLVTDAIYAASEVLGSQARRSEWWQDVIDTLPVYTGPSESAASRTSARQNVLLAQLLHSALEIYRCGSRPSAEVLVPLKQIILCTPAVPALRRGPWTQFTTDDIEWQQSQ